MNNYRLGGRGREDTLEFEVEELQFHNFLQKTPLELIFVWKWVEEEEEAGLIIILWINIHTRTLLCYI